MVWRLQFESIQTGILQKQQETEGNLRKGLGKLRNDMKEIQKALMNKNKNWVKKMRRKETAK